MNWGPWQFGTTELIAMLQLLTMLLIAWWAKDSVQKWITQRNTLRKAEVAEEVLALLYEAEEVFKTIRNPLEYVPEDELSLPAKDRAFANKKRRYQRVEEQKDFFTRMYKILPVSKTLFPPPVGDNIRKVIVLRNQFLNAADTMYDYELDEIQHTRLDNDEIKRRTEKSKELRCIIFGKFDEDDKMHKTLIDLRDLTEKELQNYLE